MEIKELVESLASRVSMVENLGKTPIVVAPEDYRLNSMETYLDQPTRTRRKVVFVERHSFIDYCNVFRKDNSVTFCKRDGSGMSFMTVFDYDTPGVPSWASHDAKLELAFHPDYMLLKEKSDKWFDQEEFALFIEGNTHLFMNPTGADMLELAQELKGVKTCDFVSGKRLSNGRINLEYIEKVEARGVRHGLEVPESLELIVPIFDGQNPMPVKAAFRWRTSEGKVAFAYRLLSVLEERAAFEGVRMEIEAAFGKPSLQVAAFPQ